MRSMSTFIATIGELVINEPTLETVGHTAKPVTTVEVIERGLRISDGFDRELPKRLRAWP